ncbi:hypothetical protein MWU75_14280 [Ornithinimicrobium sp. F0845]|uniref:hypothetical protein n=1 Tax=Ornithinimicrobium sp. F0845 TaxID=2926412 RepID=UPI001FF3C7BD|nr:hypothetical protein [Ornithinimicrobium sp. F0845]MCK0113313.1 hypothetical protein [Ornithinimicrobium sp. F0845]
MTTESGSDSAVDGVLGLSPDGAGTDVENLSTPLTASFAGPVLEPTKTRHSALVNPLKTRHSAGLPLGDDPL